MRLALGIRYNGRAYEGWQSQLSRNTVQDKLEDALGRFAAQPVRTLCAGRTDAGVHALMQVVHFDTAIQRELVSWVRGTNRFLPDDIAVQWARPVDDRFHCRASALSRRYLYVLSQSPVRPSLDAGRVGWTMYKLNGDAMRQAASALVGQHDFTSFRASACQALSPVKTIRRIDITQIGGGERCRWHFEFEADSFLHHMIRNIVGSLLRVGRGDERPEWMGEILEARSRKVAAPTFAADGLYFVGPLYDESWGLPPAATYGNDGAAYDSLS
ncbi:MAG: tRNA pseudouridine(38-40) synthase TruA [Gammaproteobacteria bacterium]|nr:tRNA pseudouridine(38-40) synthase TruA [Gammaproteobacteria bacterium]MBU1441866.1 tRNA pseudouridine(38-40) synthase TruA [Gammaproteobacteria bacterium]MBU2289214.1 tRNA pseudouridine(38-40) synthase TruA [Gammaproteobacteria bacterium]MBU2407632.1 tRNA pseudouridine(38-40) synthase TruA [Gammaproteobacteria bacterium]